MASKFAEQDILAKSGKCAPGTSSGSDQSCRARRWGTEPRIHVKLSSRFASTSLSAHHSAIFLLVAFWFKEIETKVIAAIETNIGKFARPKNVYVVPIWPETRSGKLRRVLAAISNQRDSPGEEGGEYTRI